jgi:tripartite-type tricarboxylate transporter receptor subunit TctC
MTQMTRRTMFGMLTSLAAVPALASLTVAPAFAQSEWPQTTLLVPFPPGGSTDTLARLLAAGAQQRLGATVIVENKAGAMGSIGAAQVAKSAANGSSFLVTFDSHALIGALIKKPLFDIEKDLEPVLLVGTAPYVIAANPSRSYNTFADVVAAAKQQPGRITYSSAGPGTLGHLAMILLAQRSGIELTHVPYKGASPAIVDAVGGHVDLVIASIAILLPQLEGGKLRGLMQTGRDRAAALKDLPTAVDSGFADFEALAWWGVFAPKGTPSTVIQRANAAFTDTLKQEAVSRQLHETQQIDLILDGPEQFHKFFARQIDVWGRVVRDNNISAAS